MTVKAEYRGMTFEFPDGTPDDQIYSQIQQKFEEDNKDYGDVPTEDKGWGIGSLSDLGSSITEGWSAMGDSVMAANAGPAMKEEALRQYELQEARVKGHEDQLGTAGQLLSGVGRYGPAIAAGVGGTVLTGGMGGLAAGGLASATMAYPDTLRAQYGESKEFDQQKALLAAGATGLTDVATGGLGKYIAKPGASLLSRTAQQAKTIAAEDMTSAAASKVYENWAADKDLLSDVDTAALMGGVAGGAVRGGMHQGGKVIGKFQNAARDMGIAPNKGSEQSINETTSLEMGPGPSPNPSFADDYINFSTVARNARDDLNNSVDDADMTSRIEGLNKILEDGSHLAATSRFGKALQSDKAHLIDTIYDANIETADGKTFNIGRDGLNLTDAQMVEAREAITKSEGHNIPFKSRTGELEEGITGVSFNEKSQTFGRGVRKSMQGNMDKNLTMLKERSRLANMEGSGASASEKAMLKEAVDSYTGLREAATSYNKEADGIDTTYTAQVMSKRFNDVATRLGIADDIIDINGVKGDLNPLADWKAFTAITEGFRAQNKQFSQGKPDTLKPMAANAGFGVGAGIGYLIHPGVAATVAATKAGREAYKMAGRKKARGRVAEAKARVSELTPEVTMFDRSIDGGDGPGAAAAAAKDLEAQGIKTPEPIVEAPVSPVEAAPVRSKADAKVRRAPAPKAIQEPVVEAPAPTPKPEAKAAAKPQKSKSQVRKEKEAARKAEADARKQAKNAEIAAKMQEELSAPKPLGRSSPARMGRDESAKLRDDKLEQEVADQKVEYGIEDVLPTPKADAKAKRKPVEPKKAEEPVVEEAPKAEPTPEPEAPKADAKARSKPAEPKKAEQAPEPVQEAAPKKERKPLGRKTPERKVKQEEAPESVTEAPVKEAEVEATVEKAAPAAKLVRQPLKAKAEESWSPARRKKDPAGFRDHLKAKEDLKSIDNMMRTHDKYTEEEIAQVISDTGGAKAFLEEANSVGKTPDTFLGLRMRELQGLRNKEIKAKTSEMKDLIKKQDVTVPKADSAEAKAERTAMDRKDFDDEMDALAIHPDDVAQVRKSIDEKGYSLKNARKEASRLNNERKSRMREEMNTDAAALKEANTTLDLQGRRAQVDEYVKGLKVDGDDAIQGMIDTVFKHNDTKVTPKEVQNLLNKIDNHLTAEKKRYSAIDKADPRAPEYEAMAASYRSAQNTLKSNRRDVDRKYSRADKASQEATEALTKREKDFDALFRQANERDANIVQVRNQKDELQSKLTGLGFNDMDVRKFVGSTFFERDSTPLTELGKKHVIEKFIDQQAQARKSSIDAKAKAVKSVVKDTDNGTLMQMSSDLMEDVNFDPKLTGVDELLGMTQALAEEASKRGMVKESTRLQLFNEGIIEGKINMIKYPDNPKLWVPNEVKVGIQGTYGNSGGVFAGNLLRRIKTALTGDAEFEQGLMSLSRERIKDTVKKEEGAKKGKLLTGDDDIIVR